MSAKPPTENKTVGNRTIILTLVDLTNKWLANANLIEKVLGKEVSASKAYQNCVEDLHIALQEIGIDLVDEVNRVNKEKEC